MKRYVYRLSQEELYEILQSRREGAQILRREGEELEVALFFELADRKPLRVEEVKEDWESWRERFTAVEVGDFVVIPPWKRVIRIKPGRAFGTGLHPTTQLCLKLMPEYLKEGMSMLDVGTGSGILAIAGKLLGAERVLAIDVSEEAVEECRENAELNGVEVECIRAEPRDVRESFDLVVANLEIGIFRRVLGDILSLMGRVGIFSGLYGKEDLREFTEMLGRREVLRIEEKEGWYAVVLLRG
ncbi:MAG: 50S ribosomal protein L11 methyltransferase [Aquificae bacterium]|nr:50S ribosomal protein L11 methyltransferase [Aquificota bacterium]